MWYNDYYDDDGDHLDDNDDKDKFLSGMMTIKNGRPRRQKLKKS